MMELLDIVTRHASSEEVVRTIFVQSSRKAAPSGGRGHFLFVLRTTSKLSGVVAGASCARLVFLS
jgi:hypothetical protein